MDVDVSVTEVRLGVLLDEVAPAAPESVEELDDTGHVPASGYRGAHREGFRRRVVVVSDEVLRAAATAVGREVAEVVSGVVAGLEEKVPRVGSFDVGDVELKFGVKAVLGAGKAVEALLSASGEATVEVTVKLRQRPAPATS